MNDITVWLQMAPVAAAVLLITLATSVMDFTQGLSIRPKFIKSPYLIVHRRQYYRILTGALIHAGWLHLFLNLFVLYSFSLPVEAFLGHWQFLVLYVGSQLVSAIPDIGRHRDNPSYASLGASGAISGVVFCYILVAPTNLLYLFFAIPIPAWLFGLLYLGYSHFAARRQYDNVNHYAHFWGAVGGLIFTGMLAPEAFLIFAKQMGLY